MKKNLVGSLFIEHLKEYHQGLFNHLTKDCDDVVAGKRLTNDMDSHFKGVSAIIIMRGSIVSWLIMTLSAYLKIILGIHPGMMFLLIRRSCATRTIIPRCLYLTGIAMKNNILLEGVLSMFFKM